MNHAERIEDYLRINDALWIVDEIDELLLAYGMGDVCIKVTWGDWKHSHLYLDHLMQELGYELLSEKVTEENGSDTYSSDHYYFYIGPKVCPICGEADIEREEGFRWHCHKCDALFSDEDVVIENLRHSISAMLNGTSEENPRKCDIVIGEAESQGLSELEKPHITQAFEIEGDGRIFFKADGWDEWQDFDNFSIYDLKTIDYNLKYN